MKYLLRAGLTFSLLLMTLPSVSSCIRTVSMKEEMQKASYTICPPGHLPGELQGMIDKRKKKACTFTFSNANYTYLIVCYGRQACSGYSIRVIQCSRNRQVLYLKTCLLGPSKEEAAVMEETWPYIVVRCRLTKKLCIIKP